MTTLFMNACSPRVLMHAASQSKIMKAAGGAHVGVNEKVCVPAEAMLASSPEQRISRILIGCCANAAVLSITL
jgi:hypothetical protein